MDRANHKGKTALITGASGGIGLELARLFARDGFGLALVARSGDKLAQIREEFERRYNVTVHTLPKDLADPAAPDELFNEMKERSIGIDALVNNAGFTVFGPFVATDYAKERDLMQVNIVALTHLTKLFLPGMVERGWGRVLNVASTAAFMPGPLMAVYYASKAYVLSFSEALAVELRGTGVSVTALCPGPTETGFQKRGEMEDSRLVAGRRLMSARAVARIGYQAMMKGQDMVVPGFSNWLTAQFPRFLPHRLAAAIISRAQERV